MSASEAALIARLRELFPRRESVVGIGDDAAVLGPSGPTVITSDMLVENVDFTSQIPMRFVARKALTANLSDLAAMGATPRWFTLALGFPDSFLPHFEELAVALAGAAREARIELIGGDLSRATEITISITACGSIGEGSRPLLRNGAKPGDRIYLSRPVGAAAAGLTLLQNGWLIEPDGAVVPPPGFSTQHGYATRELAASMIHRHIDPEAEIALGVRLAAMPEVTSCIDVSDGFSTDLHHLCEASQRGAEIEQARVPVYADLTSAGPALGINTRNVVLNGGEEYALLFTSTLREAELSTRLGRPVYAVGRITRELGVILTNEGRSEPLDARGFDHFA